jgi:hypothetical protein
MQKNEAPLTSETLLRRKTMKTMFLAAAAALSLGIGSAYADGGDLTPDTRFTELQGVIAHAPVQNVASIAAAQTGQATRTYVTQSSRGTWLFQANQNQGANS